MNRFLSDEAGTLELYNVLIVDPFEDRLSKDSDDIESLLSRSSIGSTISTYYSSKFPTASEKNHFKRYSQDTDFTSQ